VAGKRLVLQLTREPRTYASSILEDNLSAGAKNAEQHPRLNRGPYGVDYRGSFVATS
jgi:hypothetical protein